MAMLLPFAAAARKTGQRLYLTGGFLRDRFSGRRSKADLDLAAADPGALLAAVGRRMEWKAFVLDRERDTWRVVFRPGAALLHIDVTRLQGSSISEDLSSRDFTVNALAVDVTRSKNTAPVHDPLGGLADLEHRILRACSPESFEKDPLRVLRGFRLAASLSFRMEKSTLALAEKAAALLPAVSGERIRQELFAVLQGPDPRRGLTSIVRPGILAHLSPAFRGGPPGSLKITRAVISLLDSFSRGSRIVRRAAGPVEQDVTGRGLIVLAAFFRDRGETGLDVLARHLRLGNKASSLLRTVAAPGLPAGWLRNPSFASTAGMLALHKACGEAVEGVLLVEAAATLPPTARKEAVIRLGARYGRAQSRFLAPSLLTGRTAMKFLGLPPGERLGSVLRAAREAQDLGCFTDLEGAVQWARRHLA